MAEMLPDLISDEKKRDEFIRPFFDRYFKENLNGVSVDEIGMLITEVAEEVSITPPDLKDVEAALDDGGMKADSYSWEEFQNKWNLGIVKALINKGS